MFNSSSNNEASSSSATAAAAASQSNYFVINDYTDLADPDVAPIVERATKLGFKLDTIKHVLQETERCNVDIDKIVDKLVEYDMRALNDDQDDGEDNKQFYNQQQQQQLQHQQATFEFTTGQFGQMTLNENYDPLFTCGLTNNAQQKQSKQQQTQLKSKQKSLQNKKIQDEETIYKEYASKLNNADNLRYVVIDALDIATVAKDQYRFKRILQVVKYFLNRSHKVIGVCPQWLKDRVQKDPQAKEEQMVLHELTQTKQNFSINYVPLNHDDDLMVLHVARVFDAIVVSNDTFKKVKHSGDQDYRKIINERLLKYYFLTMDIEETFVAIHDPLGKKGPTLDNFLRKIPIKELCPFKERCTFGSKCGYFHAERDYQYENYRGAYTTMLSISEEEQKKFASLKEKRETQAKKNLSHRQPTPPTPPHTSMIRPLVSAPIRGPVLPSPTYSQMPKLAESNYFAQQIPVGGPHLFELNARGPSNIWQSTCTNDQWSYRPQNKSTHEYSLFPLAAQPSLDIHAPSFEPKFIMQQNTINDTHASIIKALVKRGIPEDIAQKTVQEYPDIDDLDSLHDLAVDYDASHS